MSRIIALILFAPVTFALLSMANVPEAPPKKQGPRLVIAEQVCNLGEVSDEKSVRTAKFVVRNEGTEALIITETATSCGCVSVKHPARPIKPGAKAEVKVVYDGTAQSPGRFKKTITLFSNDVRRYTRIFITGKRVSPNAL